MQHNFLKLLLICLSTIQLSFAQDGIKVAIVGGGMAGVSAAHHILALNENIQITLFEKEATLGGNARTIQVENKDGNLISIDAGPQYFQDALWPNYIKLLRTYNIYNEAQIFTFSGSVVIENDLDENPDFISPDGVKLRGGKLKEAFQFLKFYKSARKVYEDKAEYPPNIEDWLNGLKLNEEFKKKVALPFLASTLGTSVNQIKICSTKDIVKLFASQKALKKSDFKVFGRGMGFLIQDIGKELERNGVHVQVKNAVNRIECDHNKYIVYSENGASEFDFIVFAAHPYQVSEIVKTNPEFDSINAILNELEYFQTSIVLHRDSNFIDTNRSSFMNIKTSKVTNSVTSSSMNLGVVNPEWAGLYKSWMTSDQLSEVQSNGTFIHREFFNHPLITPKFIAQLGHLKTLESQLSTIYFAGGWSEGLETQETATNSGKKAAEKVKAYLNRIKN